MIFTNTRTTAVVLIKAEIPPAMNIKTGTIRKRGNPLSFFNPWVNQSITPLSSRPMAMIIRASTVMVAGLEKPDIASSGLTRFVTKRPTIMKKAILSTGNTSSEKRKITTTIIANNMIISRLIINIKLLKIVLCHTG